MIGVLNAFSQNMINSPVSTYLHKMASSYSVELQFQPTPSVELPFNFVSKLNSADSLLSHQVALTVCWWELQILLISSIPTRGNNKSLPPSAPVQDGYLEVLREATKKDCNAKDEDGMTPTL